MPKVLLTEPIPGPLAQRLQALLPTDVEFDVVPTLDDADFAAHAADADVLLVLLRRIDASTLTLAPRVRFVQRVGVGHDNVDITALAAAGVGVAHTPGANAEGVAEHTIMLMLALLKRLPSAEQAARAGRWPALELIQSGIGDLAGATIGLVGLGNIGRAVAARLAALGTSVRTLERTDRRAVDRKPGKVNSFQELNVALQAACRVDLQRRLLLALPTSHPVRLASKSPPLHCWPAARRPAARTT